MGGDDCQMSKFFVNDENIENNIINITGQDFNHIKNVLRLKVGDNIIVSNGKEIEFDTKIVNFTNNSVEAEILNQHSTQNEPSVKITLFQGLPKSDRMELIIQKAVEIGIYQIVPVLTERVVVKVDEKNAKKKTERWEKIAEQASKQSGRNIIPEVSTPIAYKDAIRMLETYDLIVIFYEKEQNKTLKELLNNLDKKPNNIAIFIGPEGGFSESEIELVKQFNLATLGPRILRTETAGLISTAVILYHMGDLG